MLHYLSITIQENRLNNHFQKLNFFFLGFTGLEGSALRDGVTDGVGVLLGNPLRVCDGLGVTLGVLERLYEMLGVGEGLGEMLGVLEG